MRISYPALGLLLFLPPFLLDLDRHRKRDFSFDRHGRLPEANSASRVMRSSDQSEGYNSKLLKSVDIKHFLTLTNSSRLNHLVLKQGKPVNQEKPDFFLGFFPTNEEGTGSEVLLLWQVQQCQSWNISMKLRRLIP